MARHSFRSLLEAYHSLQEENAALRLGNVASQRQLSRQASSIHQLRTELGDQQQTIMDLREGLEDERETSKGLREGHQDQSQIIGELRGKLQDQEEVQEEAKRKAQRQFHSQLEEHEASKKELQVQLREQEKAYQALLVKYKESDERITKGIAEETQQAYRWAITESERAGEETARAEAEKERADAEKERADAEKSRADNMAEENHYIYRKFMSARDWVFRVWDAWEAIFDTVVALRRENLRLRIRLRATEPGLLRRIRNATH